MSTDPRTALNALVQALEEHLVAVSSRRGEQDSSVESAYLRIADAFEVYEDALYVAYDEVVPLELFVEDDDEDEEGVYGEEDIEELDDVDEDSDS